MTRRDMLQEAPDKQDEIEHTLDDYERELLQAIEEGRSATALVRELIEGYLAKRGKRGGK